MSAVAVRQKVGLLLRKVYPFGGLLAEAASKTEPAMMGRTKMVSGKKTSDDAEKALATDAAAEPVGAGYVEVDDVPDRLLILANRLQKALDARRVVNARHPGFKKDWDGH